MESFFKYIKKTDWKLWGCFLLSIAVCIPIIVLNDFPQRDVAFRYAPMAAAFARGDWLFAFHPRVQMLHPTFGGIFSWLFSVNGYIGAQLSGVFFHGISVFPLFALLKETFGKRVAYWGIFAYVFSSRILFTATSGLREPHKQFVILLLTLGIVLIYKYRQKLTGYITAGIACGLAVCTRNDMVLFTVILFAFGAVLDCCKNVMPWRSMIAGLFGILFALPEFFVNYKTTDFALPGTRFLDLFSKTFDRMPTVANVIEVVAVAFIVVFLLFLPLLGWILRRRYGKVCLTLFLLGLIYSCFVIFGGDFQCKADELDKTLKNLFYGLLPIHFCLMLPGLLYRIIRKKFTKTEMILLSIYLLQGILVVLLIAVCDKLLYVSARYLLPAAPLYFGWIGISVLLAKRILKKLPVSPVVRKGIVCILFLCFIIGSYIDSLYGAIHMHGKGKLVNAKRQALAIAEIIRNDYKGKKYWNPKFNLAYYAPNTCPKIHIPIEKRYSVAIYYANGSFSRALKEAEYVVTEAPKQLSGAQYTKIGAPVSSGKIQLQVWKRKPAGKSKTSKRAKPGKKVEKKGKS